MRALAPLLVCLVFSHCQPQPSSSGEPATARTTSAPAGSVAPPSEVGSRGKERLSLLRGSPLCNRTDRGAMFVKLSGSEAASLVESLRAGPVAVRYRGCEIEILNDCKLSGAGKFSAARSCCATTLGCARNEGIDCYDGEERYWFGREADLALNLPEFLPELAEAGAVAAVVRAQVREQYRLDAASVDVSRCVDATHLVEGARLGSLRVEAEGPRAEGRAPERRLVYQTAGELVPIDLSLFRVVHALAPAVAEEPCMGAAARRGTGGLASFFDEEYVRSPSFCFPDCRSSGASCVDACLKGARGSCSHDETGRGAAYERRADEDCRSGFGMSCASRGAASAPTLEAICTLGGDASARACGELSKLLTGDAALEYAWTACQRGRFECQRVHDLLAASGRKDDARYHESLRLGCASGEPSACCTLGAEEADSADRKESGLRFLREYCERGAGICCRELKRRGHPVPTRRPPP